METFADDSKIRVDRYLSFKYKVSVYDFLKSYIHHKLLIKDNGKVLISINTYLISEISEGWHWNDQREQESS